jgi:predicted nucleotidyltransferase
VAPGICEQFGIQRIGIFGSYARGDQKPGSDVDILVELDECFSTLRNFVGLADHLEQTLHLKVDLLTVQGIDPYIRTHVESEVIWIEG